MTGLDAVQMQRASALTHDVLLKLPATWRDSTATFPLAFDPDLPPHVVGRHRLGRLRLSPEVLVPSGMPGRPAGEAALIHEIAHAFDRSDGHWSRDRVFRRLAGWDRLSARNPYRLRSMDEYELTAPAEAFAVNVEGWLLEHDYPCRRPGLSAWLTQVLGQRPLPAPDCDRSLPFLASEGAAGQMQLESIDPARLFAVDYLLADSGGPPMSRFGHSMLRLVICAPGREPGERCRMDLTHHRVLSFRAFVNDVRLSAWRGVTGGYPARLYVLSLEQVMEEYNRTELRDLRSFPLRLDAAQRTALLQAAARTHWTYDGRYAFVGNNCADETGRLLDLALRPGQRGQYRHAFPRGVLRALVADGVTSISQPDTVEAIRSGLYLPSARAEFVAHQQHLLGAGQARAMPLERFLDASPGQRGDLPAGATLRDAAAWTVLEHAALRRAELRALATLAPTMLRGGPLAEQVGVFQTVLPAATAPGAWLAGRGYGIPQADDVAALQLSLAERNAISQTQWQSLLDSGQALLPAQQREDLQVTRERAARYARWMRELAAAEA